MSGIEAHQYIRIAKRVSLQPIRMFRCLSSAI